MTLKMKIMGGVALLAALGAGIGIAELSHGPTNATAEDGHGAEDNHDEHGDEHGGEEDANVVELTARQIEASGITVVTVGHGGGAEERLSGRVSPTIDARAVVNASIGGRIERVLVAPGTRVRAGQGIAVIVSGEGATFRAEADAAAAEAEAARLAYQRDADLGAQGIVARQDVEAARARSLAAEAGARAARARAAASGNPNAGGRITITAPIAGVVGAVQVAPGGFVAQGGPIAELSDPARLELVFNAPAAIAASLRPGMTMRVEAPSGAFEAEIVGVGTDAGNLGAATVRARSSDAAMPPAGVAVAGIVVRDGAEGGLSVPADAVQTVEGQTVVFVAVDHGFRVTPVLVGRQAGGRVEILRGLNGDERVAAAGAFLLKSELAKGEAGHAH